MDDGEVKPNFKKAVTAANEVLASSSVINGFPFSIEELVKKETDLKLCSYERAIKKFGVSPVSLGSNDAFLSEKYGRFILFYENESIDSHRVKWSITHEFAHFYLGHDLNYQGRYDADEVEANYFSAQILMPDVILDEHMHRGLQLNSKKLMELFDVSNLAAEKRMETLRKTTEFLYRRDDVYSDTLKYKFSSFINNVIPKKLLSYDDEEEMQKERDSWI